MKDSYIKVIDILESDSIPWRSVCVELGKRHPDMLVSMVEVCTETGTTNSDVTQCNKPLDCRVKALLRQGELLKAIRLVMEELSLTVEAAKGFVQAVERCTPKESNEVLHRVTLLAE